jgi:hypothetical protein
MITAKKSTEGAGYSGFGISERGHHSHLHTSGWRQNFIERKKVLLTIDS